MLFLSHVAFIQFDIKKLGFLVALNHKHSNPTLMKQSQHH
jgi:hypothetical protein